MIKYTCGAGTPEEAETNCTYFIRGECTASFCEYRRKKRTNADRIRSMSDEELAANLMCPNEMGMADIHCDKSDQCNCCKCLLDWLRQSAVEEAR